MKKPLDSKIPINIIVKPGQAQERKFKLEESQPKLLRKKDFLMHQS